MRYQTNSMSRKTKPTIGCGEQHNRDRRAGSFVVGNFLGTRWNWVRSEEHRESNERHEKIKSASEPERHAISEVFEEIECGNHHADDRAECVGAISERDLTAAAVGLRFCGATSQ